jgi:hypothetical protein
MQISTKTSNLFILNFNKIFINSKNVNVNVNASFFFTTNNFFLMHSLNFFFLNYPIINSLIFSILNNFRINIKRNSNYFFKINNKRRNFLYFFKYIIKSKFKYNRLFNYSYFFKKMVKSDFLIQNDSSFFQNRINPLSFFNYFKNLSKNWYFLIGYAISPFWWDLYSKKNWVRKKLEYTLFNNRYFFNKTFKNTNKKRIRKYKFIEYKNYTKKYVFNNYFYIKNFFKNSKKTSFKYILKINPNFRSFRRKNYDWFLSKPYLFLNTYKNYKLNL